MDPKNKHISKFLMELGKESPSVQSVLDNMIESDIDRMIEQKKEAELEAQYDQDFADWMGEVWNGKD